MKGLVVSLSRVLGCLVMCCCLVSSAVADVEEQQALNQMRTELDQVKQLLLEQNQIIQAQNERIQNLEMSLEQRVAAVEQKSASVEQSVQSASLPSWVKDSNWKGDLRLRYEGRERERAGKPDDTREQFRVRFRYGFTHQFDDKTEIGARLVTGNGDPTSTNETLGRTFGNKNAFLDRIYVKYSATDWLDLYGGKFANPFLGTDLIWDSDVQPEGAAELMKLKVNDSLKIFATLGQLALEEIADGNDPFLLVGQIGGELAMPGKSSLRLAAAYYDFSHVNEVPLTWKDVGNTRIDKDGDGIPETLLHDYDLVNLYADYRFKLFSVPLTVYGDYLVNTEVSTDNMGYQVGFDVGKNKNKGDLSAGYAYRVLERDATLDALTDGTFHGGGTNSQGHVFKLNYLLADDWTLGLTAFMADERDGSKHKENTVLADLVWRF